MKNISTYIVERNNNYQVTKLKNNMTNILIKIGTLEHINSYTSWKRYSTSLSIQEFTIQ